MSWQHSTIGVSLSGTVWVLTTPTIPSWKVFMQELRLCLLTFNLYAKDHNNLHWTWPWKKRLSLPNSTRNKSSLCSSFQMKWGKMAKPLSNWKAAKNTKRTFTWFLRCMSLSGQPATRCREKLFDIYFWRSGDRVWWILGIKPAEACVCV